MLQFIRQMMAPQAQQAPAGRAGQRPAPTNNLPYKLKFERKKRGKWVDPAKKLCYI
jgi:hypothetical protein